MDDLISRSALMAQLSRKKSEPAAERYTEGFNDAVLRIRSMVHAAPVLDAVPVVHAKWNLKHIGVGHYWECSACHTNPCIYVTENTKFCPNCGARMDGEAE